MDGDCDMVNFRRLLELSAEATRAEAFREAASLLFGYLQDHFDLREGGYVVMLVDEELEGRFFHSEGLPCALDEGMPMMLRGAVKTVVETGTFLVENDVASGSTLPAGHVPVENMLFLPLLLDRRVEGVVGFANKSGGFTDDDGHLAMAFASLAASLLGRWKERQDLQRRVAWYRQASVGVSDAIVTLDRHLAIAFWNPAAAELFGWNHEEIRGESFLEILSPAARDDCTSWVREAFEAVDENLPDPRQSLIVDREGEERAVEMTLSPWRVAGRTWVTAVIRDIEHRKRAELKLLERHQEISAVFDHAPTAMMLLDGKRRLRRVNRAGLRFGEELEGAVGRLAGDAMRCIFALSGGGGCGLSASCAACGLRRVVDDCFAEGSHHHRVPIVLRTQGPERETEETRILITAVPYEGGEERMVLVYLEEDARLAS